MDEILREMLEKERDVRYLRGGLRLEFRHGLLGERYLYVSRQGMNPGTKELIEIRRALETVTGINNIALGEQFTQDVGAAAWRARAFKWREAAVHQERLL